MEIRIEQNTLDPYAELAAYSKKFDIRQAGANAIFIGTLRDFNEGETVSEMFLEHYPGMTEKVLQEICEEVEKKWKTTEILVVHRVGTLLPGEPIVLVSAWTPHRKQAFEACRFILEALKIQAPFWKKEKLPDRERWVERNT